MNVKFVKVSADRREAFEELRKDRIKELRKVETYLNFETGELYCVEPAGDRVLLSFGEEENFGYIF